MLDGVLVIKKEKDYTSHDVVAKLRGILHMKKIGHTGTLDPQAEGVLPVVLGKATRLVDLLTEKEKTYEALLHLGIVTDTQDMTGKTMKESPVDVTEDEVRSVIKSFWENSSRYHLCIQPSKLMAENFMNLPEKAKLLSVRHELYFSIPSK